MTLMAAELVNDNGISTVALGFFTATLTALTAVILGIVQLKAKANEAKVAAITATDEVKKVQTNTQGIANGFSSRVDKKLDTVIANQDELGKAFREHLEWHLEREH